MAYRIKGIVRIDDSANANLGIVTATELVGKISTEAITQQTDGVAGDVTGADELLLYDQQSGELLRVEVDEFISGAGIGTIVTDFDNLNVTGIATINNYADISQINSDTFVILNGAGTQPRFQATSGGDALLFSGGLAKLQTQSWGVQINGSALITNGANIVGVLTANNISVASSVTATDYYGSGANLTDVATSLADLTDVDLATTPPADGENLVYEQSSGNWIPGVGPAFTVDSNRNVYAEQLIGTASFTTGQDNLVIGQDAGQSITSGSENVFLGNYAGASLAISLNNVLIGSCAGRNAVDSFNTGVGYRALENASTGSAGNVAMGSEVGTGSALYTGSANNVMIGSYAGNYIGSNNSDNILIGPSAGIQMGTGSNCNIAIGFQVLALVNGGDDNIAIGKQTGLYITTGGRNTLLGGSSGVRITSGSSNVMLGFGNQTTTTLTGDNNVLIGNLIDIPGTSNDTLAIGNNTNRWITGDSSYNVTVPNNLTVTGDIDASIDKLNDVDTSTTAPTNGQNLVWDGTNWVPGDGPAFSVDANNNVYASELIGTPNFTTGTDNTVIGTNAGTNIDTGSENVIFGNAAAQQLTDGSDNVILGTSAANALSASTQSDSNVVIGNSALLNATDAIGNVSIGAYVMSNADDYSRNVVIGNFALRGAGGSTGIQNNVVMGQQAAENAVSTLANPVTDNLIFGAYAAQNITNAEFNTIIGNNAGQFIESGSDSNVLIGPNAGRDLLGVCNIAIGRAALAMLATGAGKGGDNNIAIGSYSLLNNFSGDFNVAIGLRAGQYLDNGINNVLTGACAGRSLTSGSGNTFYGLQAGDAATSANANAFFGDQAGRRIVTGVQNTLVGSGAAVNLLSGSYNNIVGSNSATGLTNASDNNVMGMFSLGGVTTGSYNTVFGNIAGNCLTGGSSRNIIIGSRAVTIGASGVSNDNLVIGYDVQMPVGNGQLHIGNGNNRWFTGDSSFNVNVPNDLSVGGTLLAADISGVPVRSESATIVGGNTQQTLTTIDMTTLSKVEFILSIRTIGVGGGEKLIDSAAFYYDDTTITAAVPYATKVLNTFINGDINTQPADMQIRYAISGALLSIDLNDLTGGNSNNPQFEWTLTITEAV